MLYSTHPFSHLWHCDCFSFALRFGQFIVQVDGQERKEHGEDLLRQCLGEMIREIKFACNVSHAELSLLDPINQPEKPHVHTLGAFGVDATISETQCHGVVDT